MRRRRFDYVRKLDELLGASTILAMPTPTVEGWPAAGRLPGAERAGPPMHYYFNTALQNLGGHPASSIPAGNFTNGLPFGLELAVPRYSDETLLAIAARWELETRWPQSAPRLRTLWQDACVGEASPREQLSRISTAPRQEARESSGDQTREIGTEFVVPQPGKPRP